MEAATAADANSVSRFIRHLLGKVARALSPADRSLVPPDDVFFSLR